MVNVIEFPAAGGPDASGSTSSNTIDITTEAFAKRLGNLLMDRRKTSKLSVATMARRSKGHFTRRQLRQYESSSLRVDAVSASALASLYEVDLESILPLRTEITINPGGGIISAGGVEAAFEPGHPESVLETYLRLVRRLRNQERDEVVSLRREDIEGLAAYLQQPGESVVEQLGALMGATRTQRRLMAGMFLAGAMVITIAVPSVAAFTGGDSAADSGTTGDAPSGFVQDTHGEDDHDPAGLLDGSDPVDGSDAADGSEALDEVRSAGVDTLSSASRDEISDSDTSRDAAPTPASLDTGSGPGADGTASDGGEIAEPDTTSVPGDETAPEPEPEPTAVPDTESEPNSEPEPEPGAETDTEPGAETDTEPGAETGAEPGADTDGDGETDGDDETDTGGEISTGDGGEISTGDGGEVEGGDGGETEPEPEPDTDIEPDGDESEPEPEPDTEPDADAEPDGDEPEPDVEPDSEPDAEPDGDEPEPDGDESETETETEPDDERPTDERPAGDDVADQQPADEQDDDAKNGDGKDRGLENANQNTSPNAGGLDNANQNANSNANPTVDPGAEEPDDRPQRTIVRGGGSNRVYR